MLTSIVFMLPSQALAATQSVGAGCAYSTVEDAVAASNPGDVIAIRQGTHSVNNEIAVDHDLTFMPADNSCAQDASVSNVVLDGNETGRLFDISGSFPMVEFENLTLKDGVADEGGLIRIRDGALYVTDCTLEEGSANQGGAVFVDDALAFFMQTAQSGVTQGDLVQGNVAEQGGAVFCEGGVVVVHDGLFQENEATNAGGAMMYDDCLGGLSPHVQDGVRFFDNLAGDQGGAIFVSLPGSDHWNITAAVFGSVALFEENDADEGGAIFVSSQATPLGSPRNRIEDAHFINNRALTLDGGAIRLFDAAGDWDLLRVHMEGNYAYGRGGAIAAKNDSTDNQDWLRLDASTLWGNTSEWDGGALHVEGLDLGLQITGTDFAGNESLGGAGGAVWVVDTWLVTHEESTFHDNVAHSDGGALFGQNLAQWRIQTSEFHMNGGTLGRGGAIFFDQTPSGQTPLFRLLNASVDDNSAGTEGGGLFVIGRRDVFSVVDFFNVKITHNFAPFAGGALVGGGGNPSGGIQHFAMWTDPSDCNAPTKTPGAAATDFCTHVEHNSESALVLDRVTALFPDNRPDLIGNAASGFFDQGAFESN